MAPKIIKLTVETWPQLIEALEREVGWLGDDPADVAKFLLIEALERRRIDSLQYRRAEWLAEAARSR